MKLKSLRFNQLGRSRIEAYTGSCPETKLLNKHVMNELGIHLFAALSVLGALWILGKDKGLTKN